MEAMVNGTGLYYLTAGPASAHPLLLVHGFPFSHAMWMPQIEALKKDYRIIAPDLRGHGKSEVGEGQFFIETLADDVLALLDALRIEKCAVCGLSMGGYVTMRMQAMAPQRFSAVILADTRADADSDEAKLKRAAGFAALKRDGLPAFCEGFLKAVFAASSFRERPEAVEAIRKIILAQDPLGVAGTMLALAARSDSTATLQALKLPTLILCGREDATTPPACSEAMARLIAGSKLTFIEKAAHMANLENPAAFNAALIDFLRSSVPGQA